MDQYLSVAQSISQLMTSQYSTSFSMASRRFSANVRPHIYNIYGLTRLADEIVDTYQGKHAGTLLDELEKECLLSIKRQYSTNPVVHAFQATARQFTISEQLIRPFFKSMRLDLTQKKFNEKEYKDYIYGSAEVVGLMCLKVFCANNAAMYKRLEKGASHLGAAYQKVNFLRDIAADKQQLGRYYFPNDSFDAFNDATKQAIIGDIKRDFSMAWPSLQQLPSGARAAVMTSYRYYAALLRKLERTPAHTIKSRRLRINDFYKLMLYLLPINRQVK